MNLADSASGEAQPNPRPIAKAGKSSAWDKKPSIPASPAGVEEFPAIPGAKAPTRAPPLTRVVGAPRTASEESRQLAQALRESLQTGAGRGESTRADDYAGDSAGPSQSYLSSDAGQAELERRLAELRKEQAQAKPKSAWQTSLNRQIGES